MSALSDLLNTANTAGLSARALARRAGERGHSMNHDTVARYLRGAHGTPDEATLVALADVLDVPLTDLRHAVGLQSDTVEPYVPPAEADRLSRRQRRAVDELIRSMVTPVPVAETPAPADGRAGLRAARRGSVEAEDPAGGSTGA